MQKKDCAALLLVRLKERYKNLSQHLAAVNDFEILIATILSAQCTDERVNSITPKLFSLWPGPAFLAKADILDVENVIRATGFYHNKAKNIIAASEMIMRKFSGNVPATMEELIQLPGVARKTANVVLHNAYGINIGLAVDTHVKRIAMRLGLTSSADPDVVEQDLLLLFPKEEWGGLNNRLVSFGREVCIARKPQCSTCVMNDICPSVKITK